MVIVRRSMAYVSIQIGQITIDMSDLDHTWYVMTLIDTPVCHSGGLIYMKFAP